MDEAVVHQSQESQIPEQDVKISRFQFQRSNYLRWLRVAIFSLFVLVGQSIAVLLGRLYFTKGGHSQWIATFVQTCGFPVLIPLLFINFPISSSLSSSSLSLSSRPSPSRTFAVKISLYVSLGVLVASYCMLFSIGMAYLPASTFSLISATQLGFVTFFSFFLNSQKITPFILNSLLLLTLSSLLLVFQTHDSAPSSSSNQYVVGFLSTVGGSAGSALWLSLMQLSFRKILGQSLNAMLDLIVYQSLFATVAIAIGVWASGEWKFLGKEMNEFEMGKVGYVMTLAWTAVCWQVFAMGSAGLIFEVSALFSNVISTLALPVVPVMAVFVFHDKMDGVKVVSLVLAVWGSVSYIYQHYVDDHDLMQNKNSGQTLLLVNNDGTHDHRISFPGD